MRRTNLLDLRGVYLAPAGAAFDVKSANSDAANRPNAEPNDAAAAIKNLLDGLAIGTPHEYERIPAIWQAAIAAGLRNDAVELKRVLVLALPKPDEQLDHWRAVVIGGGVINGISQTSAWPQQRIAELLQQDVELQARWSRLIELSAEMANDENVPTGTRYDALRVLGADDFDRHPKELIRYLASDAHAELQMGAVSGLSDMDSPAAAEAIIKSFKNLKPANKELAVSALLRTDERISALLRAVKDGQVSQPTLTPEQVDRLKSIDSPALRTKAGLLLKSTK
jgi:hypothetical protein